MQSRKLQVPLHRIARPTPHLSRFDRPDRSARFRDIDTDLDYSVPTPAHAGQTLRQFLTDHRAVRPALVRQNIPPAVNALLRPRRVARSPARQDAKRKWSDALRATQLGAVLLHSPTLRTQTRAKEHLPGCAS